jgi:hypothetical protein
MCIVGNGELTGSHKSRAISRTYPINIEHTGMFISFEIPKSIPIIDYSALLWLVENSKEVAVVNTIPHNATCSMLGHQHFRFKICIIRINYCRHCTNSF